MAKKSLASRLRDGAIAVAELTKDGCHRAADLLASPFVKEGAVLVLGLPDAGKTVFFNVMLDRLQRLSNAYNGKSKFLVQYGNETKERVSAVIGRLRESEWPDATTEYEISDVMIACTSISGKTVEKKLVCADYGGEVLAKAAGFSPEESDTSSADPKAVDNLKKSVESASMIMLVMDTVMLGEKPGNEAGNDNMFSRIFQDAEKVERIALIFTKGDMLDEETKNSAENFFINRYPNTISQFKSMQVKFKAFLVTAAKCPDLRTPPKDFDSGKHSEGLIEPIEWLLDIKVPVDRDS
jgi:hypothetical protein